MIKTVPVFSPLFKEIQNSRDELDIYVYKDSNRKFEVSDILRIEEMFPTKKDFIQTGYFMHVEVTDVKIEKDKDGNKIYLLKIKPRLDKRIKLRTI